MSPYRASSSDDSLATDDRQPRIVHRTEHLPPTSRVLYRIEHYSTLPTVGLVMIGCVVCGISAGAALGFTNGWIGAFEVSVSAITLAMVFAIQHTQAREQAATQRKLDELLRALPEADQSLMMLEEAPKEALLDIEENQRVVRSSME